MIGSFSFATGATFQGLGVKSTFDPRGQASDNSLTLKGLLKLFLIPKWLIGLGFVLLGAGIHLFALTIAPVTVVQPVGILAVPWAVLIASKIHGHKITPNVWKAVLITVVGVVGFTLFSATSTTEEKQTNFWFIFGSFLVVCLLCGALSIAAHRVRAGWLKPVLWSSVGAMFYGLASGLMKSTFDMILKEKLPFSDILVWGTGLMMIACYGLGVWMIQQGYASGPAEITVGTMTTVDPFVAVLFGLIVLGEGTGMSPWSGLGMALAGAVAVWGVILLSRDHPDAVAERERLALQDAVAGPTDPSPSGR